MRASFTISATLASWAHAADLPFVTEVAALLSTASNSCLIDELTESPYTYVWSVFIDPLRHAP